MKVNNFGKKFKSYISIVKGNNMKKQNKIVPLPTNKVRKPNTILQQKEYIKVQQASKELMLLL